MKRPHSPTNEEVTKLKADLLELIAGCWGKSVDECKSAWDAASSEATILDLGLTSAQAISLKGRVMRELEAEVTTFELLKQPLRDALDAIDKSRRAGVGAVIPECGPPPGIVPDCGPPP